MIRFRIKVNGHPLLDEYGNKMLTFDKRTRAEAYIREHYANIKADFEIIEVRAETPLRRAVRAF